jgi:predicted ArsR family transcriptional regulator
MPFQPQLFEQSVMEVLGGPAPEALREGAAAYATAKTPAQKARCIGELMVAVDETLSPEQGRAAMQRCACIGQGVIDKARAIQRESADLEDLLARLNDARIGGGYLALEADGSVITAAYDRCYCGSVKATRAPISSTYCACSCGWYARLFEALLGQPVRVELRSAIIAGADRCRFAIHTG